MRFKVCYSKKDDLVLLPIFYIPLGILDILMFYMGDVARATFVAIFLIILLLILLNASNAFYVEVNESKIKVRTRSWKKYEFDVSDIEEVFCSSYTNLKTAGTTYSIQITAKSKMIEVNHTMVGFDKIAGYLLEKYESGEIKANGISEESKKELIRCKNKEIFMLIK